MLLGFHKVRRNDNYYNWTLKRDLRKLLLTLLLIVLLHVLAMVLLEKIKVMDAVWLTFTTITTVGYGDIYAATTYGRITTIILIYIAGIATLAQTAAMYFEYRQEIRNSKIKGNWSWKMKDHIVFINCPKEAGEEYFYQAISQLRNSSSKVALMPIVIVSDMFPNGISDYLRKLNVRHVGKPVTDDDALESASVKTAHTIVVFSKTQLDPSSDSINFDLVDRLRGIGVKARIIAEVVRDENRIRLKKAGADNVLRPIRTYPELLTRSIIAPGSEQVIEVLFNSSDEECIRYNVQIKAKWMEIIQKMMTNDIGLPIAYEGRDGKMYINPLASDKVSTTAIFVIVNDGSIKSDAEVTKVFDSAT